MRDSVALREPFRLGVNYWPRRTAMAMWSRFDAGEIDEDFARLAGMGLDLVRFFLMWEAFQPEPGPPDAAALARFEAVLASAARYGLQTMPTLFCGHMSGVNWLPEWALDPGRPAGRFRTISGGRESPLGAGDFYRGPLLDAQRLLARALGERAGRHPAILAWDLGNEFSNLREPEREGDGAEWSSILTNDLLETSGLPVTGGIHGEDLTEDRRIRPSTMCAPWSFATMHGYPVYSAFARSASDPEVVPFLSAVTSAFSHKRVLFSEFGNPQCSGAPSALGCLDEAAMAEYAGAVLRRVHARGVLGALWWCWADYAVDPRTPPFDRATHELHFGIVRADGREKPVAGVLAAFAAERRAVEEIVDRAGALLPDERAYYAGLPLATGDAYRRYVGAAEALEGAPA
jgi:endo-1,4-beta-mannosidase